MPKNILIGNGINIQFGGSAYTNREIMKRLVANILSGKYTELFPEVSSDELMILLRKIRDIIVGIDKCHPTEEYIFLLMEIERIKNSYSATSKIEDISLEDLFIAFEFLWKKEDSEEFKQQVHQGLQQLLLDAIYNNGEIQNLEYGHGFEKYLSQYDNVFTINYDSNLDRYTAKPVFHLHGRFDVLLPRYDSKSVFSIKNPGQCLESQIVKGFEHTYSNTIMSWYWLEKYESWLKDESYGKNELENIDGKLDIIGISPCNDFQLFLAIQQSKAKNITYYYKSQQDRNEIQHVIKKNMTLSSVDKLWDKIISR